MQNLINSLFATKVPFDLDTVKSIINNHITIRITENISNPINSNILTPINTDLINNHNKLLNYILKMLNIDILINELSNAPTITAIGKTSLDQCNTSLNQSNTKLNESKTSLDQCNTKLNDSKTSLDTYTRQVFNYKKDGCDKYTSMSKNEKEKLGNMSKSVSNYLIKMCNDTKPEKFTNTNTNTTTCSDSYIVLLLLLVLVSIIYFSVY